MTKKEKRYTFLGNLLFIPPACTALGLLAAAVVPCIDPVRIFFPSLIGFTFPALLLLSFLFGLLYLAMKRKRCLLFFACIMVNYGNIRNFIQFKGSSEPSKNEWRSAGAFKILTYNVRLFDYYMELGSERGLIKEQLLDFICDQDADIICLQEYYERKAPSFTVEKHLKKAGYAYSTRTAEKAGIRFGNVIYSRFPIIGEGSVSDMSRFDAVYADMKIGRDTVRLYNIHLQSYRFDPTDRNFVQNIATSPLSEVDYKDGSMRVLRKIKRATIQRSRQVKDILSHISESCPVPSAIVCGDMNDQPVSYAYGRFRKSGFDDAFVKAGKGLGQSYKGYYPSYRIDYILFKGNSLLCRYFDTHKVEYSDHRPVSAVFEWEKKE